MDEGWPIIGKYEVKGHYSIDVPELSRWVFVAFIVAFLIYGSHKTIEAPVKMGETTIVHWWRVKHHPGALLIDLPIQFSQFAARSAAKTIPQLGGYVLLISLAIGVPLTLLYWFGLLSVMYHAGKAFECHEERPRHLKTVITVRWFDIIMTVVLFLFISDHSGCIMPHEKESSSPWECWADGVVRTVVVFVFFYLFGVRDHEMDVDLHWPFRRKREKGTVIE